MDEGKEAGSVLTEGQISRILDLTEEDAHDLGVEMDASLVVDVRASITFRPGLPVGPLGGEGIPHVHHRKDAGRQGDLLAFELAVND